MKLDKWLVLILILNILLRIPSLFDPVSYGDECIYLTLGQALNKGLVFYRDIHDNKPPLLYIMAALAGGKQVWFRLITIFWTTINVWFIYLLAQKVLTKRRLMLFAALLFVILSYLPEGKIPNGENYMIMPFALGVLLLFTKKAWFWAGLTMSVGFLFKVPVGFDFVGILLAYFIYQPKSLKKALKQFKQKPVYLFTLGFILPVAFSIIYYWSKDAFTPYVRSALMQNIGYLSSWGPEAVKTSFIARNQGLVIRGTILFILSLLLFLRRKKLGFYFAFFSLWFIFALFGVLLSERPYPHYFIELVPSASILALLIWQKITKEKLLWILLFIFMFGFSFYYYQFWWYPNIPYLKNFAQYALKQKNTDQFLDYFGGKAQNDWEVARYIKTHSKPDERVFIWGDGACIYALSERLPPGRYTVNYHIFDFNGHDETIAAIKNKGLNIIIKLNSEKRAFAQLEALLAKQYILIKTIGEAEIYHKIR